MAGELGPRLTSISPGVISKPLVQEELNSEHLGAVRAMIEASAAGRPGTPDDIAAAAVFLLGPEAPFVTGTDLHVTGGVVAAARAGRLGGPEPGGVEFSGGLAGVVTRRNLPAAPTACVVVRPDAWRFGAAVPRNTGDHNPTETSGLGEALAVLGATMRLITVGHGTSTRAEFVPLLHTAGIEAVVDVRTAPGSRHNPDFNHSEIREWLPEAGVDYRWDKRLGGFRKLPAESPDTACRNEGFRAYAAHMRTEDFGEAVEELLTGAANRRTAVMCSESVWWRCHRRMIADYATLVRGVRVVHLMHDGKLREHRTMDGVRRREDDLLVYDGGQLRL